MKYCLIKQPAGLGDIMFLQKIAHVHKQQGFEVIWPVNEPYKWIGNHIPFFTFPSVNDDFPLKEQYNSASACSTISIGEHIIITTDGCGNGSEIMKSKYDVCGISWQDWADYNIFTIDNQKSYQLFEKLGLSADKPYALSMKQMGSPPNHVSNINIPTDTHLPVYYIEMVEGYTLFDWCLIIEYAEELYLEGSSPVYIIECLPVKAKKMFLFSRDNHKHFNGLFKKPWIWRKEAIK